MFVIITYDVEARKNRKVLNLLRRYCYHEQNSVFDGELTKAQLRKLKEELSKICADDKVTIYTTLSSKAVRKESSTASSNIYG